MKIFPNEQQRRRHANNPKLRRNANRESYARKKRDSDANLAQFHKDDQFGPEFICVCCHEGLFERQVHHFTDERKDKIGKDLITATSLTLLSNTVGIL